ncbi:MAG: hypothetical protein WEB89_09165 [Balneolales bacterium]
MKFLYKTNLCLTTLLLCLGLMTATEANAQVKAGGGLAYGSEVTKLGIQANGYYTIPANEQIRAGLEFTYFFPESYEGGSSRISEFNVNGNYFFYEEDEISAYGLAGISHITSSVSWDETSFSGAGGASGSWTGINLGGGAEYEAGFGSLYGELKFVLSTYDQLVLSVGTRIPFDL